MVCKQPHKHEDKDANIAGQVDLQREERTCITTRSMLILILNHMQVYVR